MKKWVQENAARRAASTSKVEQNAIKLDMNSIYGKTLQNKKKMSNNSIYANVKKFEKAVQKFNVVDYEIVQIEEDSFFGIVSAVNTKGIILDTPRLIGFTVLEDARAMIMTFHFYVVKEIWKSAKLLFSDTDSAMHHVGTKDPIADMLKANASGDFPVKFDLSPQATKLLNDLMDEAHVPKPQQKVIQKAGKTRKTAQELSAMILEASRTTDTSSELWNSFMSMYDALNEYQGVLGAVKEESLPLYMSEYCGCQSKMYATKKQDLKAEAREAQNLMAEEKEFGMIKEENHRYGSIQIGDEVRLLIMPSDDSGIYRDGEESWTRDAFLVMNKQNTEKGTAYTLEKQQRSFRRYEIKLVTDDIGERKGKGIKRHIVKKLSFDKYLQAVREPYDLYLWEQYPDEDKKMQMRNTVEFQAMRFRKHSGGVEAVKKKGVTAYNDKIWALSDHESRPLGHWRNLEPGKAVVSKELGRHRNVVPEDVELDYDPFADVE